MKKSVLLFPGTDALEDPRLRVQALLIPEVFYKLRVAQQILTTNGFELNLFDFMRGPNNSSAKHLISLTSATVAVQVALFERYLKTNTAPDFLLGCSMGDAAKSIALGAVDFSTGLINMTRYITEILKVRGGAVLRFKLKSAKLTQTGEFPLPEGLHWSVLQTPRHALVGGDLTKLFTWAKGLDPDVAEAQLIYPFPLHTPLMHEVAAKFNSTIEESVTSELKFSTLSTVSLKNLTTKQDLIEDLKSNITQPVRWWAAAQKLNRQEPVEFVNLGPSPTLIKFNKYIFESEIHSQRDFFQETLNAVTPVMVPAREEPKDGVVI